MMTAAEASPLYVQPAGEAAEGVFVQASMGAIGKSLPPTNRFKKLVDDFAGPFEQANKYYPPQFAWDGMIGITFMLDAIARKGAEREAIRAGLDSIDLDTPEGHYTYTPEKHYGMPDSANLMSIVKNGDFVPAPGVTEDQLAKAGQ
jgi:branched-chain amino acid transport system substrate-binding protein